MEYIKKFLTEYPSLKKEEVTTNTITLSGYLEFSLEYEGFNIYKNIFLKIVINNDYPISLPKVYDIENVLLKDFHKNSDGSLCLGTELEIRKELFHDFSLKNWIEKCLNPFVFSSLYFEKYRILIFGEREHGSIGEINSIKDFLEISSSRETYLFINFILFRKYRRKIFKNNSKIKKYICPICNKKIFKCQHFSKLDKLNLFFNKKLMEYLKKMMFNFDVEVKIAKYKR